MMKHLAFAATALALLAGCASAQTPPNVSNTNYVVGVDIITGLKCVYGTSPTCSLFGPSPYVYPSPSGQASNGVPETVGTVSGNCIQFKASAGNWFTFSVLTSNTTSNFIWVIDTSLTTVSGTLPQGSGSTAAAQLLAPKPVPADGHFDFSWAWPTAVNSGMLICFSTSATTISAASGTITGTAQKL